jgi:hypothetical protein
MKGIRLFGTLILLNAALFAQEDSLPAAGDSLSHAEENASATEESLSHAGESISRSGESGAVTGEGISPGSETKSRIAEKAPDTRTSVSPAGENAPRAAETPSRGEESTPRYEIGAIIGEPTGISGKVWLNKASGVDGAVAWGLAKEDFLHLHADLLIHNYKWLHVSNRIVPVYAGVGGVVRMAKQKSAEIGLRLPVGISYMFYYFLLDIFLEIAPILELVPSTSFNFNGGIGLRFMFGKSAG